MEGVAAWQQKVAIERAVFGSTHEAVANSLAELARMQEFREVFIAARKARQEVLAIRTRLYGESNWRVTSARLAVEDCRLLARLSPRQRQELIQAEQWNKQVVSLYQRSKPEQAVPLAEKALRIRGNILGEKHQVYAASLNHLALLYQTLGDHNKAVPLFEKAVALSNQVLGERHPDYATSLNNLALLYLDMGEYPKALPLFQQALDLSKEALGENHPDYATSLNNLALLYKSMGNYRKALPLYEQARDICKEVLGAKHPDYARSLNNLGALYYHTGDYRKALPLYQQAVDLRKSVLGEKHPHYAASVSNLAVLYRGMGDYKAALRLSKQALGSSKEALGTKHPDHAVHLNNLAALYMQMGEHKKALPLLRQVLQLRKEALGEKHPLYTNGVNNLGNLYMDLGEFARALPLLEQALRLYKEALGEKHPSYASSLHNLALSYRSIGNYEKALPLFQHAVRLRKEVLGAKHPDYVSSLSYLGGLYDAEGKFAEAESLLDVGVAILREHVDNSFTVLSERQRLDLLTQHRIALNTYLSVASRAATPLTRQYGHVLNWKGATATHHREERLAREQAELYPLIEQLQQRRAGLARLTEQQPATAQQQADWRKRFDSFEKDKERLEVLLAARSVEYRKIKEWQAASAQQVTDALPERTALIDFLHYTHYTPSKEKRGMWRSERRLVAFVLLRDRKPVAVSLGASRLVEAALIEWSRRMQSITPGRLDEPGRQLAQRVWVPLRKHLEGITTVLIAPDGVLCRLPFAALPGRKEGSYLIDEYSIGYLTSGRQLLELNATTRHLGKDELLAIGGLDYGKPPKTFTEEARPGVGPFAPLAATKRECEVIATAFRKQHKEARARPLSGAGANAERLKQELSGTSSYRYVHLATHGFFERPRPLIPLPAVHAGVVGLMAAARGVGPLPALPGLILADDPLAVNRSAGGLDLLGHTRRTFGRNPMLLCGLVLAGANSDPERGLLTAEEVADLDLRSCELAVLSACETGLGKLAGGEGVLGLQRAFQAAGARTLVTSLWSVDDAATALLMQRFYENLFSGKKLGKLEALRQAQRWLLHHPDEVEQYRKRLPRDSRTLGKGSVALPVKTGRKTTHPAFWAAFVLCGDFR
jgi:CHAT domain-containing protein/Tfp pilus assembly protein PilF